ncbi:flagellar hook protein FlgE [Sulfurospirillum halorespirans DSM 13726]|uniref:Flagellar hook protein FlgE n=2 Tax=Sulfurospirillum halorespirans TaxID=194424 RepID=A0A1D7TP44_9BACT|nr:flagellar hook protein FlgE [Sulfurospirillum halorespirans DSM 13726]
MRALWAGVTGLQAHQTAMDVESNNIANVNTTGYKYSRANFATLLSQTTSIATAPTGTLGGQNSTQIGLGTTVSTVTKIFSQGSIETTDKDTDLAISGSGFFVVSPDGGTTYKYTRDGDFEFDADGNFVDSNGYIVQGWLQDEDTGEIDTTSPVTNITIAPGLTTPASATTKVTVKANLDSGTSVGTNKTSIYSLDSNSGWVDTDGDGVKDTAEVHDEDDSGSNLFTSDDELTERGIDFGVLYDSDGEAISLNEGQGSWISYADAETSVTISDYTAVNLDITINGTTITNSGPVDYTDADDAATQLASLINAQTASTGVTATVTSGNKIVLSNDNSTGTTSATRNIKIVASTADTTEIDTTSVITAYQYAYTSSGATTSTDYDDSETRYFTTTEDLRNAMQTDARTNVDYTGDGASDINDSVSIIVNDSGQFEISNTTGDAFNEDDGDFIEDDTIDETSLNSILSNHSVTLATGSVLGVGIVLSADTVIGGTTYLAGATVPAATINAALTTETVTLPLGSTASGTGTSTIESGTNLKSADETSEDYDLNLTVTGLTGTNISQNDSFISVMDAIQGTLTAGTTTRTTENIYAAALTTTTEIYDSLGSKHTLTIQYTKTGTSSSGGTEWSMVISVPEPGELNSGVEPENIVTGTISFNSDGSLSTYTPRNLTYTANNGSTSNQSVSLDFGSLGQFDGITSFDKDSSTSSINQNGYAGGDLTGISIDETGTIIGSFSNGYSFSLAQVAMATFTNETGLESDGGNCYISTTNSGTAIVGQASTGSKGSIQSSALEMSNADLSRSLTQLIVIQRGYQASSKVITTADEMLNVLLQMT